MKLDVLLMLLLALLFFGYGLCFGQVSVIHFNSEWNAQNDFDITTLKDCEKENITICHNPKKQEEHSIVSVPTIIVFDDGEENIMMELEAKKDIQKEIDKIMLEKFE